MAQLLHYREEIRLAPPALDRPQIIIHTKTKMDGDGTEMDIDPPNLQSLSLTETEEGPDAASPDSEQAEENIARIEENDRIYTSNTYFLPDDQLEETRQSIMHQAFTLFLDRRLTMASISPLASLNILDVGAGGGEWALAMSTKHTASNLIATDISPNIGSAAVDAIPANLEFEIDDARDLPWTYESEQFDFIHMRGLGGAFTELELTAIYREAYRCLKIGGTLEAGDFGAVTLTSGARSSHTTSSAPANPPPTSLPSDAQSYLAIYNAALDSAAGTRGLLGANDVRHVAAPLIEGAGFRIQRKMSPMVPLGEWSRDFRDHAVGRMINVATLEGFEAKALRLLTRELGWSKEDVRELCERAKAEVLAPGALPAVQCQHVMARKLLA